jgi:hypothetical protein
MKVVTEPNLRRLPHGFFSLQTSMVVEMNDGTVWTVPAGFITDFSSSRFGRWNFLGPDAYLSYAAILHDFLYNTGKVTKHQADLYFQEGLKSDSENVGWCDRWKGYWGVRLFGGCAWRAHRRNDPSTLPPALVAELKSQLPYTSSNPTLPPGTV